MTPLPLTADLLEINAACLAGISSHRARFPLTANPYEDGFPTFGDRSREQRLKAWAFALGWREAERLGVRQTKGAA